MYPLCFLLSLCLTWHHHCFLEGCKCWPVLPFTLKISMSNIVNLSFLYGLLLLLNLNLKKKKKSDYLHVSICLLNLCPSVSFLSIYVLVPVWLSVSVVGKPHWRSYKRSTLSPMSCCMEPTHCGRNLTVRYSPNIYLSPRQAVCKPCGHPSS